jgi:hypothetical protein
MEIIGQVVKIQTTADMCVRIVIDADKDAVPADACTAPAKPEQSKGGA